MSARRRVAHLVSRFVGSLRPGGAKPHDVEWARSLLGEREWALWERMAKADRRESIAVARRTAAALAGTEWDGDDRYLAAALLHDVGKSDARLGPIGRALATMAGAVAGHQMAPAWQARGGIARRFGVYLRHDEIGAGMLRLAGAPSAAVEWAEAHHHPERWPALTAVPLPVAEALARADGEQVTSVSGDECR